MTSRSVQPELDGPEKNEALEFVEWIAWLATKPVGSASGQQKVWNWIRSEAQKVLEKERKKNAGNQAA